MIELALRAGGAWPILFGVRNMLAEDVVILPLARLIWTGGDIIAFTSTFLFILFAGSTIVLAGGFASQLLLLSQSSGSRTTGVFRGVAELAVLATLTLPCVTELETDAILFPLFGGVAFATTTLTTTATTFGVGLTFASTF